ncbi:hypothetical protein B0O99DRAFT_671818 [Bisporella sp. PMI_857]|nr:hypothetical protein B0O99DRAFT_671818 [Bisporella sp. PMI_857]
MTTPRTPKSTIKPPITPKTKTSVSLKTRQAPKTAGVIKTPSRSERSGSYYTPQIEYRMRITKTPVPAARCFNFGTEIPSSLNSNDLNSKPSDSQPISHAAVEGSLADDQSPMEAIDLPHASNMPAATPQAACISKPSKPPTNRKGLQSIFEVGPTLQTLRSINTSDHSTPTTLRSRHLSLAEMMDASQDLSISATTPNSPRAVHETTASKISASADEGQLSISETQPSEVNTNNIAPDPTRPQAIREAHLSKVSTIVENIQESIQEISFPYLPKTSKHNHETSLTGVATAIVDKPESGHETQLFTKDIDVGSATNESNPVFDAISGSPGIGSSTVRTSVTPDKDSSIDMDKTPFLESTIASQKPRNKVSIEAITPQRISPPGSVIGSVIDSLSPIDLLDPNENFFQPAEQLNPPTVRATCSKQGKEIHESVDLGVVEMVEGTQKKPPTAQLVVVIPKSLQNTPPMKNVSLGTKKKPNTRVSSFNNERDNEIQVVSSNKRGRKAPEQRVDDDAFGNEYKPLKKRSRHVSALNVQDGDSEYEDAPSKKRGRTQANKPSTTTATISSSRQVVIDLEKDNYIRPIKRGRESSVVTKKLTRRTGGFPRFNEGAVYICLTQSHRKYTYILELEVLSQLSPWFAHTIENPVEEADDILAAHFRKETALDVRYELVYSEEAQFWILGLFIVDPESYISQRPKPILNSSFQIKVDDYIMTESSEVPQNANLIKEEKGAIFIEKEAPVRGIRIKIDDENSSQASEYLLDVPLGGSSSRASMQESINEKRDDRVAAGRMECLLRKTSAGVPVEICEAYNNLFLMFYNMDPELDMESIDIALRQAQLLTKAAYALDCLGLVLGPVTEHLYSFGRKMYEAILRDPPVWLSFSMLLGSALIFKEAIIHMVGQYPNWPWTSVKETDLCEEVRELIRKKADHLAYIKRRVDTALSGNTIAIDGQQINTTSLSSSNFNTWVVVTYWRDWLNQSLSRANDYRRDSTPDRGTYRLLAKGGYAYLKLPFVFEALSSCLRNGSLNKREVALDLMLLKNYAAEQVQPLCVNNSVLSIEEHGIAYFTCTEVANDELPWNRYETT